MKHPDCVRIQRRNVKNTSISVYTKVYRTAVAILSTTGGSEISNNMSRESRLSIALHDRLDPSLFDAAAQLEQHGHAKQSGKANPTRLRETTKVRSARSITTLIKISTDRDMPRHAMLARERGRIRSLRDVYETQEHPNAGVERIREEAVAEHTREPPVMGRCVLRDGRGIYQEEDERARRPDLERHFEVRDLRGFGLLFYTCSTRVCSNDRTRGERMERMEWMWGVRTVPSASSASAFMPSRRGFTSS
jgi:hypothetical protein